MLDESPVMNFFMGDDGEEYIEIYLPSIAIPVTTTLSPEWPDKKTEILQDLVNTAVEYLDEAAATATLDGR
jgi:hypothetical protein